VRAGLTEALGHRGPALVDLVTDPNALSIPPHVTVAQMTGFALAATKVTARFTAERMFFHVILSAYWEPLEFELPLLASGARDPWRRWIDTFLDSPHDIVDWEQAPSVPGPAYRTEPRSVVVLFAGLDPES